MKVQPKKFYAVCDQVFSAALRSFGFKATAPKRETDWFARRTYKRGNRYIRMTLSAHPLDHPLPPRCEVMIGEGDTSWPETDWNAIPLGVLRDPTASSADEEVLYYPVDSMDEVEPRLLHIQEELLEHANDFLDGEGSAFRNARSAWNQQREPYRISTPNERGQYEERVDPISDALKRKYS